MSDKEVMTLHALLQKYHREYDVDHMTTTIDEVLTDIQQGLPKEFEERLDK